MDIIQKERHELQDKMNLLLHQFQDKHKIKQIILLTSTTQGYTGKKEDYIEICTVTGYIPKES
jgi:hypothetical protein